MKALFGLCVVALAASISSGLSPGHEYHYHLEGKMVHELAHKVHQHAGFLGKADVILQVKPNVVTVKIENPEVAVVNERPDEDPEHLKHNYVPYPSTAEALKKPFEVHFKNHLLHDIKVHKDDPYWSVNVKKAVASALQLNFNHANVANDLHGHDRSRHDNDNYYHVMEDGLVGECEVIYEVDDATPGEIHVTKTKNLNKCKSLNYKVYENDNRMRCLECGKDIYAPLQASEICNYKLRGNRKNFVVENLTMEERFAYVPYGRKAEYISGDTKVRLTLVEEKAIGEEIQVTGNLETHNDLHFEFEDHHHEIKTAEDLKKVHNNFFNVFDKPPMAVIYKTFDEILQADDGKPYTEAFKTKIVPTMFIKLKNFIERLSYDEIAHMLEDHVDKGITDEKLRIERRTLFGYALLHAGTGPAFMFLKHAIIDLDMKSQLAAAYLMELPRGLKEFSPVLLEEFYTLCENPKVHEKNELRTVCYLAFSRFAYEHCVKKHHNLYVNHPRTHNPDCTPEIAEKYFKKMVKSHEGHAKNSLERTTCIKTAGNFGTLGSLEYLRTIIHDTHLHPYYRFSAIWALWTNAATHSEEVVELVLPIYFNSSEPHEIRSAALILYLYSKPEMQQVQTIAENLEHEIDDQVKHFTVSTIRQVANAHAPCYQAIIGMCKRVLGYLDRIPVIERHDLRHSFTSWTDGFDKKFKIGGGSYLTYITSNDSYIPQHVSIFADDYMGRELVTPIDITYTGYGLDKLFDHFFPFAKRKGEDHVDPDMQNINEKLKIHNREHDPMLGDISVSIFGGESMFFHFSDEMFENAVAEGAQNLPDLLQDLKDKTKFSIKRFHLGRVYKFIMPSAIGWPVFVSREEVDFLHFRNNQFKLKVDPALLSHEHTDTPPSLSIKTDFHLVNDHISVVTGGALVPAIHSVAAAGVLDRQYNSLPLKLKIVVEPTTPKVVLKYTPIIPHTRIMRTFMPFTATHNMGKFEGDALKDGTLIPYNHKPHELVEVEKHFFHDYLGYGIDFKGKFARRRTFDSWGSFWKFMLETNSREKFYFLETNPKANMFSYEVALTPAKEDPTTEIDVVLTFDHYGMYTSSDKEYKPNFPTVQDGHENYPNSRGDRKSATCVLKAEKVSKGNKERKLVAELAYTFTLDNLYHKLDIAYDRAPYHKDEKDHFKICYSSSILFPHIDTKKVHDLQTVDMDPKIHVAADVHFGKNCNNDKKITVRGEMSRTEEHRHMQAELETADPHNEHDNYDAHLYHHCKKDNEKGIHYSLECRKFFYRALKLRHYSFDIQHENLSEKDKVCASELEKLLELSMIYYLDIHHNEVVNDSKNIHVEAEFSAKDDEVDITIKKPKETIEFKDVPHPEWIQARSATPFFDFTNKIVKSSYYRYPYCSVEGDHVKTFDKVHYEVPNIGCYKVLAKDCSEKSIFAVLAKKIDDNSKAVKIILPHMKIEAHPAGGKVEITLNGNPVAVTEAEPYIHHEKDDKGHDQIRLIVSYDGLLYRFKSMINYGVTVYYDGKAVVVYLSPYYRGKQCGLCGDFNNNNVDEFLGPQNCVFHNATDFVHSYAIPDGCDVPAPTDHCIPHPSYEI